jgi:NAD(P)-dependent dehydrogenase (short-subunit alcohol dehydrogenase family)
MDIEGRIVLVTGAASGIGEGMCRAFAARGAQRVIVTDIDEKGARRVAAAIGGDHARVDVSRESDIARVIGEIEAEFGRLDILCANAGIAVDGSVDAPDDDWHRSWSVNLMAHVYATRHALPGMVQRSSGYIVTTASAAGLLTNLGAAPYTVTKHAAVALAEWLAITYRSRGIRVSCLCPQFVDTPMLDVFAGHTDEMRSWVEGIAIPVDEVAEAVMLGIEQERFLILPHPEVSGYVVNKATDPDRWIAGMARLQAQMGS